MTMTSTARANSDDSSAAVFTVDDYAVSFDYIDGNSGANAADVARGDPS